MDVCVRRPAMLLSHRIEMCRLSQRGQVELVFSLPGRVNGEKITVARHTDEQILEKCRGALRHAGDKDMSSQLVRSGFSSEIREPRALARGGQRIRQIHVRTRRWKN